MNRVDGWSDALVALINEAEVKSFRWAVWDCCQFGARAIAAQTGRDPRSIFPHYRTKAEAEVIILECGGMEGLVRRALPDIEPVHPSRAMRGAIVLGDFARGRRSGLHGVTPGLCMGEWSLSPGRRGLERLATLDCRLAWNLS